MTADNPAAESEPAFSTKRKVGLLLGAGGAADGVAVGIGENPFILVFPTVLAANCAFMMPVATPPNAVCSPAATSPWPS